MQLLLSPACLPFVASLGVVAALGALQAVLLLMGGGFSLESKADGVLDADTDGLLGFLGVGELPLTLWFTLASLFFGALGLLLQLFARNLTGNLFSAPAASLLTAPVALLATGMSSRALARALPREETEAVSHETFVGCEGIVTTGVARAGRPAEARVRDKYGRAHYVMVEPQDETRQFPSGAPVLLLRRDGERYRVAEGTGVGVE